MKNLWLGIAALTLAAATGAATAAPAVSGDYLESRSLSIYAGACHYGGEAVTAGQEAVMAWKIKNGEWKGQNLDGLSAVAVVNGPENLALNPDGHRTLIYVDKSASVEQRDAIVQLLTSNYGKLFGEVVAVKSGEVTFDKKDKAYRVRVPGAVFVAADKYPCEKCVMPHQVWYTPFVPVTGAQVARSIRTEFKELVPNFSTWSKEDSNSAYVAEFAL